MDRISKLLKCGGKRASWMVHVYYSRSLIVTTRFGRHLETGSSPIWRLSRVDTTRAGGSCCRVVEYFPNVFRGSCARWAHQHFKCSQRFCLSFSRVTDLLRHPGKIDMRGERMRYHTDNFCCLDLHERVKHRWLRTPPRAFLLKHSIEGERVATA